MDWYFAWAALLIVILLLGAVLTLLTLPGNWLMVLSVAVFAYFFPASEGRGIGWTTVGVVLALAIVGELLELVAGAIGAKRVGGSKRAAALALLGSLIGAVVGVVVGLPIPVVGSLIGPIIFAGLGALAGAMLGESWKGTDLETGWKIGQAAFWGRLLGSAAKVIVGSMIVVIAAVAAIA